MAGTYTEITNIVAPSEASQGQVVDVAVDINDIWSGSVHVYCVAVLDSENRFIDWLSAWQNPGDIIRYRGSFIMPNTAVTINAYSYYEGTDGYMHSDDSKSKNVALAELAPTITEFKILDFIKS